MISQVIHKGLTEEAVKVIKSVYNNLNRNPIMKIGFKTNGIKLIWFEDSLIFESKKHKIDASKVHLLTSQYAQLGLTEGKDYLVELKYNE